MQVLTFTPISLILDAQISELDGGWHLIYHLSPPPTNNSINDYIDPASYSSQYTTIVDAIKICYEVGRGVLLAKVDLKNASGYRRLWLLSTLSYKHTFFHKCIATFFLCLILAVKCMRSYKYNSVHTTGFACSTGTGTLSYDHPAQYS